MPLPDWIGRPPAPAKCMAFNASNKIWEVCTARCGSVSYGNHGHLQVNGGLAYVRARQHLGGLGKTKCPVHKKRCCHTAVQVCVQIGGSMFNGFTRIFNSNRNAQASTSMTVFLVEHVKARGRGPVREEGREGERMINRQEVHLRL